MAELGRPHHFVPIFYLSGFAKDASDGTLYVFDKTHRKSWISHVRDVGLQKDLYLLECQEGQWTDAFEKELARVEGRFAPVLESVIAQRRLPSSKYQFADLLRLVSVLYFRTPAMRAQFTAIDNNIAVQTGVEHFNSGEYAASFLQEHGRLPRPDEERDYQRAVEALHGGKLRVKMNPTLWIERMTQAINQVGPYLAFHQWSILSAKDDAPDFICSDTPVVLSVRKPTLYPKDFRPGISTRHIWILMPVSRRLVLIGSQENKHPRGPADVNQVAFINKTILVHCHASNLG